MVEKKHQNSLTTALSDFPFQISSISNLFQDVNIEMLPATSSFLYSQYNASENYKYTEVHLKDKIYNKINLEQKIAPHIAHIILWNT